MPTNKSDEHPDASDASKKIRALRDRLRLKQEELATKSHLSRSTIGKIDSGVHRVTAPTLRASLARGFGVSPERFDMYLADAVSLEEIAAEAAKPATDSPDSPELFLLGTDPVSRLEHVLAVEYKKSPHPASVWDATRAVLRDLQALDDRLVLHDEELVSTLMRQLLDAAAQFAIWDKTARPPLAQMLLRVVVGLNDQVVAMAEDIDTAEVEQRRRARYEERQRKAHAKDIRRVAALLDHLPPEDIQTAIGLPIDFVRKVVSGEAETASFYFRKVVGRAGDAWMKLSSRLPTEVQDELDDEIPF